ncbi:hypothetical protein HQ393_13840 [Chitinibacter bivalviorum]|uniref:Uncharacterized protein n=1 Tax=Chitinibacter bivalviorum TaxID=2739434 RepID=A0A7H9BKN3_9NEIS|nr:hypothetical protein [Chitinibacter bivalviorum]QLG89235.1 hypothetical protein HQ393_13840 [Chitinibacter bivalviorum]
MATFLISPDIDAAALGLNAEEAAVYRQLCSRRQCTSTELIKQCRIQNPHALIEAINVRLKEANSEWLILCSVTRAPLSGPTQSMRTPVGYYRLRRNAPFQALS